MIGYLIIVRDKELYEKVKNINGLTLAYNPIIVIYSDILTCKDFDNDEEMLFKTCHVVNNESELKEALNNILNNEVKEKILTLARLLS